MKTKAITAIIVTLFLVGMLGTVLSVVPVSAVIPATIDIDPDTLNLKSKGQLITCYIELPEGHDVSDIDVFTILLEGTIPVVPFPVGIGDYDKDFIPDLMVKFDRAAVAEYIIDVFGIEYGDVTLTITGQLFDGTPFDGADTIRAVS